MLQSDLFFFFSSKFSIWFFNISFELLFDDFWFYYPPLSLYLSLSLSLGCFFGKVFSTNENENDFVEKRFNCSTIETIELIVQDLLIKQRNRLKSDENFASTSLPITTTISASTNATMSQKSSIFSPMDTDLSYDHSAYRNNTQVSNNNIVSYKDSLRLELKNEKNLQTKNFPLQQPLRMVRNVSDAKMNSIGLSEIAMDINGNTIQSKSSSSYRSASSTPTNLSSSSSSSSSFSTFSSSSPSQSTSSSSSMILANNNLSNLVPTAQSQQNSLKSQQLNVSYRLDG